MLLCKTPAGWALPSCPLLASDRVDFFSAAHFNASMRERLGVRVRTRYSVDSDGTGQGSMVVHFQNLDPEWQPEPPLRWVPVAELSPTSFKTPLVGTR